MAKDTQQGTAAKPVTYTDTGFRSRVIVFPDDTYIDVQAGRMTVTKREHIEYMDSRKDFRRVAEQEC